MVEATNDSQGSGSGFQAAGLTVLVFAALLVLLIAGMSYRDSAYSSRADEQLGISQQILFAASRLLSSLQDAETGQRGFLLTGREAYLDPFRQAASQVPQTLGALTSFTASRPDQARRVSNLKPFVESKLNELNETIGLYRSKGKDAALAVVLSDRGKGQMDRIRQVCQEIQATSRGRMVQQTAEIRVASDRTRIVSTAGSGVIFALLISATLTIRGGNQRRQKLIQELSDREAALRESQELIGAVIDNSPAVISVKALSGRYILVNRQFEKIFDVTRGKTIGKTGDELFPKEQAEVFRAVDRLVASSGEVSESEETRLGDGGPRTYLSISFPIRDGSGNIFAVGGVSTDITERKRSETLRALLASIVESSSDAIVSKTPDGIVTSWNPAAENTFGYSAADMIGQPLNVLIPPDAGSEEADILARIRAGEFIGNYETVRIRKDRTPIEVSLTVSPLMDAAGKVVGISNITRDITERKRSEKRLQSQLERLQLLDQITRAIGERQDLDSIFQVVVRSLENGLPIDFGCVCLYDPAGEALTVTCVGVRSEALATELALVRGTRIGIDQNGLGRGVRGQLVYEPDIRGVDFPFPRRLSSGGLCSMVIAPLSTESRVFGIVVAARGEPNGFSSGDCEFLHQLSGHVALAAHQAQIYETLQQAYDDLRQTRQAVMQQERLRALGQMASGIAHDINNALAPVALYTGWMLDREPNLSERNRKYLEITQRALDDVSKTVARMQEFYRHREPRVRLTAVHLNPLIQQVLDLTRARWSDMPQQRGVVIQAQAELARDLPEVPGIESDIREALVNLILNSVDAMPDGGTLTLRTSLGPSASGSPQRVHLEIEDTGVGMEEETLRRCLEPFFTTKGERGTGLGLAMVFGIMRRHNAEIEIKSVVGKGTTVLLSFPAIVSSAADRAQVRAPRVPLPRMRILLIDDDPVILRSLQEILESDGHLVTATNGGQEGIESFKAAQGAEPFAVVITDLGMPRVDGRRVASAIKALSASTPVILLTGWGQRLVTEGEIPQHVDRVLAKPPKLHELNSALAELVAPSGRPEDS